MSKTKNSVKLLASGKVSMKLSAPVLVDLTVILEQYMATLHGVPIRKSTLSDIVFMEMYHKKFSGYMVPSTITLRLSEAIALLNVWKSDQYFRASNMVNALLMKLDQKLG